MLKETIRLDFWTLSRSHSGTRIFLKNVFATLHKNCRMNLDEILIERSEMTQETMD